MSYVVPWDLILHKHSLSLFNIQSHYESADKTRSGVSNVDMSLVKKKVLILPSNDIDAIKKSDIYDT